MNFHTPMMFWWLLTIPLIVILYFLKLKRSDRVVSSTFLWKKSVEELRVNSPFQKLRRNLLLFLQILIALLATLALAGPFLYDQGFRAQSMILLIDQSASMQTTDGQGGRTRLAEAKEKAREIVGDMSRSDRMAIIAFSEKGRARTMISFTQDRSRLLAAIDAIEPLDTGTDVREAMGIASALAKSSENPETYLLTDGRVGNVADIPVTTGRLFYVRVGSFTDNAGIVAVDVRRNLGRTTRIIKGRSVRGGNQLYVSVQNSGQVAIKGTLSVHLQRPGESGFQLYDGASVSMAAGETTGSAFDFGPEDEGRVRVDLEVNDAADFDNTAYGILAPESKLRVHLATSGNYFLVRALGIHPLLKVEVSDGAPPNPELYDILIWDRIAPPEEAGSRGNHLCIGVAPPVRGAGTDGTVEPVEILDVNNRHPVTRFASLRKMAVAEALKVTLPGTAISLVDARGTPLIAAIEEQNRRHLFIGFDIYDSDWPTLGGSFAIFIKNAIDWLGDMEKGRSHRILQTGDILLLKPNEELGAPQALETPEGERIPLEPDDSGLVQFAETEKAGFYAVEHEKGTAAFACNLNSASETHIEPVEQLEFQDQEATARSAPALSNLDIWWYLALGLFGFLLLEWYIYNRRVYV